MSPDQGVLDDPAGLALGDPEQMLRVVASSAAQLREAARMAAEAGVHRVADEGRPRAVVALGMGGSGIAGDVLAAVAGQACPVPVVVHKGYGLPGWVGPVDLVVAASYSGGTEETLSGLEEAARRGARVLGVGAPGSPFADLVDRSRGVFVPVTPGRQPRASLWSLAVPVLLGGAALGLLDCPPEAVEAAAVRLEALAVACAPAAESFTNPAKSLAAELAGALPVVWGCSPVTTVAAYRTACQLNENAKSPCLWGGLPEADHNQVVAFDGPHGAQLALGGTAEAFGDDDFFRDRVQAEGALPLRLLMLRDDGPGMDGEEHPQVTRRAEVSAELARARGLQVVSLVAEGASRLERVASLVGLLDHASVYLGLMHGLDPTPVGVIEELKRRIR